MKNFPNNKFIIILTLYLIVFVNSIGGKIYLIGDSTVYTYDSSWFPQAGWGQELQFFLNKDSIKVINKAIGGRSAKSFYRDHWSYVRDVLEPGDYVFVQFGINDAANDTSRYSAPWTGFQYYLTKFVKETQEKDATCVLVATLRRNAWNATTPPTMYDAYHDYPVSTRVLADSLNVPLIDLDEASKNHLESMGPEYTGPFLYMNLEQGQYTNFITGANDNVHFQEMGAIEMARLVVEEMKSLGSYSEMAKLIPYINPMHEVAITSNLPEAGITTRTASYPEGIYTTIKTKPNLGYEFKEWQDPLGNIVSEKNIFRFKMGTSDLAYKAFFAEAHDTITIQENEIGFCNIDGSIQSNLGGYTGDGYAVTIDSLGAGINWQINIGQQGNFKFIWRYTNDSSDLPANLIINGNTVSSEINFNGTGDLANWDTTSVILNLTAGTKEVRLESTSSNGMANIDYFKVIGGIVEEATCGSSEVVSGEIYRIINKVSCKALEIADASNTNGANVQLGAFTGSDYQLWQVYEGEPNYYALINQGSNQLIDVEARSTEDGANILQWPENGGNNQDWILTEQDSGWFTITARHSGKCLQVENASLEEGANVCQWTENYSDEQLWKFDLDSITVDVKENFNGIRIEGFKLDQNYPNPFNPETTIAFSLPSAAEVSINIYDISGRLINKFIDGEFQAGIHKTIFDGTNLASGVYFVNARMRSDNKESIFTNKILLLK